MDYTTNADMFSARFRLLENKSQAIPPRHPDGKLIQTRVQSHRTRFRSAVRRTHQNNANNAPVAVALGVFDSDLLAGHQGRQRAS